jgi:two-component system, cell cycle sensor histidine kinase and response regulator CckA
MGAWQMTMILVVDDEPMICDFVSRALQRQGFSVVTATNGADALSISQSHRGEIELVIADVRMPHMDGPTFAKNLYASDPDIPLLFMSGQYDPSDLDPFEDAEFLPKPFSIERLVEEVGSLIPGTKRRAVN